LRPESAREKYHCFFVRDNLSPNLWSDRMKKLIPAVCLALFALSATATYAADDKKKAEPAKAAASAPAANASAVAATAASAPVKKKEKKGGC
jgi:hypothetical protein